MLAALVLCCAVATLVNPFGVDLPRLWVGLMTSPVVHANIKEHLPLLRSPNGGFPIAFGAFYLAVLLSLPPRSWRVTWLLPIIWFGLAWTRIRHGPLFAAVALVALADMIPRVGWLTRLGDRMGEWLQLPTLPLAPAGWRAAIVPVVVVATILGLHAAGSRIPVIGRGWARLDPKVWPLDLLPELRAYEQSRPAGTPIFNPMKYGGFLIYRTPGLRVFIDDRCELYGDERLAAYVRASNAEPWRIDEWADQYGFDRALTVTGTPFDYALRAHPRWHAVKEAPTATFWERIRQAP